MQTRNSLRALAQDTIWSVITTLFLVVAGFGLNVLVGNLFGNDGLGYYSLAIGIYLFLSSLSTLGQPFAVVKYTAEFIEEPETGNQYFTAAAIFVLVSGLTATGILLGVKEQLVVLFNMPELSSLLPILAFALPFFGLNKVITARLNGQRRMRTMAIFESIRYALIILLTWLATRFWNSDLIASIWPFLIAEIGLFIMLWFGARLQTSLNLTNCKQRLRELTWFGSQVTLARLMGELNGRLDLFLAGYFLAQGEVGIYAVALMFGSILSILPNALQKITSPVMADLYARKQIAALETFTNQVMQLMMLLLTLLVVPMIILFQPIIKLIYPGQEAFLHAQGAFNILVAGFVFRGVALTIASIYGSIGRPDIELKIAPVLPIINCIVGVLLVNHFGINGIAAGAASAAFAVFILWTVLIRPVVGIQINYRPLFVLPVIGMLITLMIYFLEPYVPQIFSTIVLVSIFALLVIRMQHFDRHVWRLLHQTKI